MPVYVNLTGLHTRLVDSVQSMNPVFFLPQQSHALKTLTIICALACAPSPAVIYPILPAQGPVMRDVNVTLDTCRVEMAVSKLRNVVASTMGTTMRLVAIH